MEFLIKVCCFLTQCCFFSSRRRRWLMAVTAVFAEIWGCAVNKLFAVANALIYGVCDDLYESQYWGNICGCLRIIAVGQSRPVGLPRRKSKSLMAKTIRDELSRYHPCFRKTDNSICAKLHTEQITEFPRNSLSAVPLQSEKQYSAHQGLLSYRPSLCDVKMEYALFFIAFTDVVYHIYCSFARDVTLFLQLSLKKHAYKCRI